MLCERACELLQEVAFSTLETFPPFNDELVRLVLEEVAQHHEELEKLCREVQQPVQDPEEGSENADPELGWERFPEHSTAVVVHHATIQRNKRLLLCYLNERLKRIKSLRWLGRNIPEHIRTQLSPSELEYFKSYDKVLNRYMRKGTGVGIDLTLDAAPPGDPSCAMRCVRDYGEVAFSVGAVNLTKGSFHFLPRAEVEPLVREGVLEYRELDHSA